MRQPLLGRLTRKQDTADVQDELWRKPEMASFTTKHIDLLALL
jgi:hypothetical protein